MKALTTQEIFDKASVHLLTQNARAVEAGTTRACRYRTPEGTSCAVGCFISENEYSPIMEGVAVADLLYEDHQNENRLARCGLVEDELDILEALQGIHDDTHITRWRDNLEEMAEDFDLTTTAMDRVPVAA